MRDRELSYWVSRGEDKAGFYVAEVDGEVAGTVCYVIGEDGEMEINRMSTHKRFRGRGCCSRSRKRLEDLNAAKLNSPPALTGSQLLLCTIRVDIKWYHATLKYPSFNS